MTKEELLTFAAKACGATRTRFTPTQDEGDFIFEVDFGKDMVTWYPEVQDSHCEQLEEKLGVEISWSENCVTCSVDTLSHTEFFCYHDSKQAARRCASTFVAAMIGKRL